MADIKHLVVLMLENRSFDHMCGFLKSASYPIDGLDGNETNPDIQGTPVQVSRDATYAGNLSPDPGHDFISVNEQIFGNSHGTGSASMQGFVKNYGAKTGNVSKSHNVMRCFDPGRLPALTTLAQEYALCDRWFASVPGPTLPNRAFAFGATSQGRVDMTPLYLTLKTIFELLDQQGVPSRIYYHDWTLGMAVGFLIKNKSKFLFSFDDFRKDCKKNTLPPFSFVEPRYNDLSTQTGFFPASDQHPDHNVFLGDTIIKETFAAVTSNQATWESTLLLITYDEHGGLYDHVPPPPTVNPGDKPPGSTVFNFDRLGIRVPAVLVSPFIPRQTIIHNTVFDHSSIIATARKLFVTNPEQHFLTERDRNANSFEDCLTLTNPRTDMPTIPKPSDSQPHLLAAATQPSAAAGVEAIAPGFSTETYSGIQSLNGGLSELQASMITQAFALEKSLPRADRSKALVSSIRSEQEVAEYLADINGTVKKIRKTRTKKSQSTKVPKNKKAATSSAKKRPTPNKSRTTKKR